MRSIAVLNQKGGVGKTTTAVNLSAALAAAGQRVCLLDLDPQAHASLHLGITPGGDQPSIYDVLTGDTPLAAAHNQADENLWVVGSHIDLAAAEVELAGVVGREVILRDKLLETPKAPNRPSSTSCWSIALRRLASSRSTRFPRSKKSFSPCSHIFSRCTV